MREPTAADVVGLRTRTLPGIAPVLDKAAQLGFLGGMPIEEQIDHALGFVYCVETALGRQPRSLLDLGSGGGVPGLVLASCWPACRVVLLDSSDRRTAFLSAEVETLFAGRSIEVLRRRAEDAGRDDALRETLDLVTARSFGSPAVVAECGAPLLAEQGVLVVSEPPGDQSEARWPALGLSELGLSSGASVRFDGRFGYQVLWKVGVTPSRFPRRVGIPSKRPLF